jgi:hypothetical protein
VPAGWKSEAYLRRPWQTIGFGRVVILFIGNTAYVVTLTGEIWRIDDVSGPPFGVSH